MKKGLRATKDSMGVMLVPKNALYGASTARAVDNFRISDRRFGRTFIKSLGLIKKHAAIANQKLGLLTPKISRAIQKAAQEVVEGKWDNQFVVDIFQTGSGTSTNMNANEVIATRAQYFLGDKIHPNDHVNLGQSSNDVIPSAVNTSAYLDIAYNLMPALKILQAELQKKAAQFKKIKKIGRTHLQDATPITLGQEFGGYAKQVAEATEFLKNTTKILGFLALGGTAVGTGVNTHPKFAGLTIKGVSQETGLKFKEASNHFAAQSGIGGVVAVSGALKMLATSMIKIANDIRWLGSGPRAGLNEIILPALQPGSSIMPGKVNPVMCEMMIQVGAEVLGNDVTISFCNAYGNFELNTMLPLASYNLTQSINLLANACREFATRLVAGIKANKEVCESRIESSLAMATMLVPAIGYDKAAEIAKKAAASGQTIRQTAYKISGLSKIDVDKLLKN